MTPAFDHALAVPVLTDAGKAKITRITTDAIARGDVPGVVTLIVNRDGVLYEGAAGMLDVARGVAMPTDAIFRIASMTKPVTSVAIMQLVDTGKIELDAAVSDYLPAFKGRRVIIRFNASDGTFETRPAAREITIRHLMHHTSGLGYAFTDPVIRKIVEATGNSETDLPLMQDPGTKWQYSPGARVLGWVVEHVSGETLDAYLRGHVFDPLKMSETAHAVPSGKVSRVVTLHHRQDGKLSEAPNDPVQEFSVRGDGGLYSTARDYARFVRLFLNGGALDGASVLSEHAVRLMGRNPSDDIVIQTQPDADPARTRPFPMGAGKDRFGLGFQITAADPVRANSRSAGSLSWGGISNTHFWIDVRRNIGGIVLMQVLPFYDDACMRTLRGIEAAVYENLI